MIIKFLRQQIVFLIGELAGNQQAIASCIATARLGGMRR